MHAVTITEDAENRVNRMLRSIFLLRHASRIFAIAALVDIAYFP